MTGYNLLDGIRVIEVAQLGPDSLGGILADLGAEVIKVEGADGDPVRYMGDLAVGSPEGYGYMHLRWNRGKKSIGLNLKSPEGKTIFEQLVATADVVIEGMRAGVLERLGLGYDVLKKINKRIVFCSLSGFGSGGPYHKLAAHGPSFDAFGALSAVQPYAYPEQTRKTIPWVPVAMHAMGRDAAIGTLAAILRAQKTGKGSMVEVSGAESAAYWLPEGADVALNKTQTYKRTPNLMNSLGKMVYWPRLHAYKTRDNHQLFFQCYYEKYWTLFCDTVNRPDLLALYENSDDIGATDEVIYDELCRLFVERNRSDWIDLFLQHEIPCIPANTREDIVEDPHFIAGNNVYQADYPGVGKLNLTKTPIKISDQDFAPDIAPAAWDHTEFVLCEMLEMPIDLIRDLKEKAVIYTK